MYICAYSLLLPWWTLSQSSRHRDRAVGHHADDNILVRLGQRFQAVPDLGVPVIANSTLPQVYGDLTASFGLVSVPALRIRPEIFIRRVPHGPTRDIAGASWQVGWWPFPIRGVKIREVHPEGIAAVLQLRGVNLVARFPRSRVPFSIFFHCALLFPCWKIFHCQTFCAVVVLRCSFKVHPQPASVNPMETYYFVRQGVERIGAGASSR